MTGGADRRLRIIARLHPAGGTEVGAERLATVCAAVTGVSGAGLMLMSGDVVLGSVAVSDPISALIEEVQFTMGEGPCVDAHRFDRPVLEPDLAHPAVVRWVAFTPPVVEAGARAVFGFPLQVGSARLGALNLYRDRAGSLSDEQHADALVMANVAAETLLLMQAGAAPDALAAELVAGASVHDVVHQATGMVAAQLDVNVTQALIRLRGRAFADGRPLRRVAEDVVQRRLRFTRDDGPGGMES